MPVCPRCQTTFLEGESHHCDIGASEIARVLGGIVIGAFVGMLGVTVYYGMTSGSAQSGLVGIFVGGPAGAVVGAIIAAGVRRR